ncbi:unnamed protein product [Vitrella brassicaformis CCMP3155]|uniref:RAP domain-containing protein n=3 Tax=Vitrella brassicaformis TaxID=1169539 RepID=A0A0G4EUR1_VITBC|nr:unnamed protein product [Vitrella brassicaformis CCMP3155]|eukprot:CEM02189.1 unnamed protein product [Vitrella brassicaformis CCMP3155]
MPDAPGVDLDGIDRSPSALGSKRRNRLSPHTSVGLRLMVSNAFNSGSFREGQWYAFGQFARRKVPKMAPKDISLLLHYFVMAGYNDPALYRLFVHTIKAKSERFGATDIAISMNALSRLPPSQRLATDLALPALFARLGDLFLTKLPAAQSQDVANIVWALSKIHGPFDRVFSRIREHLLDALPRSSVPMCYSSARPPLPPGQPPPALNLPEGWSPPPPPPSLTLSPRHAAIVASAFAVRGRLDGRLMSVLWCHLEGRVTTGQLTAMDLTSLAWAAGCVVGREGDGNGDVERVLKEIGRLANEKLMGFSPPQASNLLHSLAAANALPPPLLYHMSRLLPSTHTRFNAQDLSKLLAASCRTDMRDPLLLGVLVDGLHRQLDDLRGPSLLRVMHSLAGVASSYEWGDPGDVRRAVRERWVWDRLMEGDRPRLLSENDGGASSGGDMMVVSAQQGDHAVTAAAAGDGQGGVLAKVERQFTHLFRSMAVKATQLCDRAVRFYEDIQHARPPLTSPPPPPAAAAGFPAFWSNQEPSNGHELESVFSDELDDKEPTLDSDNDTSEQLQPQQQPPPPYKKARRAILTIVPPMEESQDTNSRTSTKSAHRVRVPEIVTELSCWGPDRWSGLGVAMEASGMVGDEGVAAAVRALVADPGLTYGLVEDGHGDGYETIRRLAVTLKNVAALRGRLPSVVYPLLQAVEHWSRKAPPEEPRPTPEIDSCYAAIWLALTELQLVDVLDEASRQNLSRRLVRSMPILPIPSLAQLCLASLLESASCQSSTAPSISLPLVMAELSRRLPGPYASHALLTPSQLAVLHLCSLFIDPDTPVPLSQADLLERLLDMVHSRPISQAALPVAHSHVRADPLGISKAPHMSDPFYPGVFLPSPIPLPISLLQQMEEVPSVRVVKTASQWGWGGRGKGGWEAPTQMVGPLAVTGVIEMEHGAAGCVERIVVEPDGDVNRYRTDIDHKPDREKEGEGEGDAAYSMPTFAMGEWTAPFRLRQRALQKLGCRVATLDLAAWASAGGRSGSAEEKWIAQRDFLQQSIVQSVQLGS